MTLGEGCRGKPNCGNEIASIFFEGVHPKKSEQLTSQTGWTKKTLYFLGWEGSCQRWWLVQNNSHHLQFSPSNCCSESQRDHFFTCFSIPKFLFSPYTFQVLSGPFRSFQVLSGPFTVGWYASWSSSNCLVSQSWFQIFFGQKTSTYFIGKNIFSKVDLPLKQSTDALHILLKQIIYMI